MLKLLYVIYFQTHDTVSHDNLQLHNTDTHQALIFKGIVNASEEQPEWPQKFKTEF